VKEVVLMAAAEMKVVEEVHSGVAGAEVEPGAAVAPAETAARAAAQPEAASEVEVATVAG